MRPEIPSKRTEISPSRKSLTVLGHHVGEIGVGLDAVEEFGVAIAVKRARLVGDAGRGLALFPLPSVDDQDLVRWRAHR